MNRLPHCVLFLATMSGLAPCGCSPEPESIAAVVARPVRAVTLQLIDPVKPLQLTGSVTAWKEQDIAFEVDGRMTRIVEPGTLLQGRWEEDGQAVIAGDLLASIDPATHQSALQAALAEERYEQVRLDKVLPANESKSQANLDYKQAEFDRIAAIPEEAREPMELLQSQASLDMALAQVNQAQADVEAGKAALDKAKAQHVTATLNLKYTQLYAPFSAEVSQVYMEAGGYVSVGQPVAHLIMMDPVMVDLAVSADTASRIQVLDSVQLFLPGDNQPVPGNVYEKSTTADPSTRTFRISIITRNQQSIGGLAPDDPLLKYPRIARYMFLTQFRVGDPSSPPMVEENRALRKDGEQYYVWAAPDHVLGQSSTADRTLLTLRRFEVVPGEGRANFQSLYLMRELVDIGQLRPGMLIALDVPDGVADGDQVLVARPRWKLRPGQLVSVLLADQAPAPGLYLPMNAIQPIDDETGHVFIAADGAAKRIKVRLTRHIGELVGIEASNPDDSTWVAPGQQVIVDYIHFLQDGEPVQVVKTVEIQP